MNNLLDLTWKIAVTRGVLGIIFGLILAVWPTTALVFVLLWGIFVLLDGLGWFVTGFSKGQSPGNRLTAIALGVLAVAAAIFAISRPGMTAAALIIVVGIWLIIRGVVGAAIGITGATGAPRGLVLLGAVLDILLGVLFFLNPYGSATVIVVLIAITMLIWGVVFLTLGFLLRKGAKALRVDPRGFPQP
ncbi:HdeD family acid-resistance protein [Tessaracoccus antarcticus]|nr:DUF308 domain-containing protein [Tessaracoccus antarcticus]